MSRDQAKPSGETAKPAVWPEIGALLAYWRDSLADADLPSPELRDGDFREVDLGELEEGRLPLTLTEELFERFGLPPRRRRLKRDELEEEEEEDPTIPVRVALFRLRRVVRHGKTVQLDRLHHAPLWLAARLSRTGALLPVDGRAAWLARRYLEPVTTAGPAIGTVDAMDAFLTQHGEPTERRWDELWHFAENLYESVARCRMDRIKIPGYRTFGPALDLRAHRAGAGDALVQLYDRVLDEKKKPPLLLAVCRRGRAEPLDDPALEETLAARHLGQMTDRFALGPAQRHALHAALGLERGQLLAINGPPGTGKTTLIQSLVASLWVERALAAGEPPILVVCSANNRAVTNVVDSFADTTDPTETADSTDTADSVDTADSADTLFGRRWLPDVESYGLYLPAISRRVPEDGNYTVAHRSGSTWTGFPDRVEEPRYVAGARRHYLEHAAIAFGRPLDDVPQVLEALLAEMRLDAKTLAEVLEDARALARDRAPDLESLEEEETDLAGELAEVDQRLEAAAELSREVDTALRELPAWEDVLAAMPSVRARRDARLHGPFIRRGLEPPELPRLGFRSVLRETLDDLAADDRGRHHQLLEKKRHLDAVRGRAEAWRRRLEALGRRLGSPEDGGQEISELVDAVARDSTKIDLLLDRTMRRRLFLLAGRYWEGRWLLEADRLLARPEQRTRQSRRAVLERFRRWAMLTPLTIATLYRLPKIFDYFNGAEQPLYEGIDLLIVDEAGQVPPEVGAPVFALARRAVVFGDVHQLEPIWNVPASADAGNLKTAGLDPERLEDEIDGAGLKASEGSLMRAARRSTRYAETPGEHRLPDGLWLREHRRSVPEIVRFCNRLVYAGLLRPERPALPRAVGHSTRTAEAPEKAHPLPAFGWAHITSNAESRGSSRRNEGHAEAIADWLVARREQLESHYPGTPLSRLVGVITPYAAQTLALREALENAELQVAAREDAEGIAVGTVHTFQGGERPIILFSPVITRRDPGYFIDRRPNLLNVAVSRARDAFLVFGDLGVFDPQVGRPSGILAQHLFEQPENELLDVVAAPHLRPFPGVRHLGTHEEHRQALRESITTARRRLLIVSPYLSTAALEADDLERLIANARRRGVRIIIGHSPDLAAEPPEEAVERLRKAGARVVRLHRYHAKILALDDHAYVVGSFNWLSAVRNPGHPFHNVEKSLKVEGKAAQAFIADAWRDVREARIRSKNEDGSGR